MATVVQAVGQSAADFNTTETVTISAVGSGNTLLVCCHGFQDVSSVTDNGGASPTYTEDVAFSLRSGSGLPHIFRRDNITDAPTTVTITSAANDNIRVLVLEVSDIDNTAGTPSQSNTGTDSFTDTPTAQVTTTTNNELGIGFAYASNSRDWTPPTGWTHAPDETPTTVNPVIMYRADVGDAGTITFDPVMTAATNSQACMATYELEAAAAPNPGIEVFRTIPGVTH